MTTLVARRPMLIGGENVEPGDELDLTSLPPQRARQLVDYGWAYETERPTMTVTEDTPRPKESGNGMACDECGKVLKSPHGVRIHYARVHGRGKSLGG